MNARQKAKKYKRMYEELLNQPVKFNVEQHKIDTLRFKRFYPAELIMQEDSSYVREIVVKNIVQDLTHSLDNYIYYKTEFCPDINKYLFYGELKVVDRL